MTPSRLTYVDTTTLLILVPCGFRLSRTGALPDGGVSDRGGRGLEPPRLVGGQDLLEQVGQAGVGELREGDLGGAVGQRGQPRPRVAQPAQRTGQLAGGGNSRLP